MSNPLFDQIDNVWEKFKAPTSETKVESIYMTCRFLSLSPRAFWSAYYCNLQIGVADWAKLLFLYYSVPYQNRPFNLSPGEMAIVHFLSSEAVRTGMYG